MNTTKEIILSSEYESLPSDFLGISTFCANLNATTIELLSADDNDLIEKWERDIKLLLNSTPGIPFDIGHTIYPVFISSTFAIVKNTPKLFNRLTDDEQNRMTFIEKVLVYLSAFASNDCNDFRTTLELQGDFNKHGGLNFRYSAVLPVVYAMFYFTDNNDPNHTMIDSMLNDFDIDSVLAEASELGYSAMVDRWNTTLDVEGMRLSAKDYLGFKSPSDERETIFCDNYNNLSYGGEGEGVNHPYTYKDMSTDKFIVTIEEDGKTKYTSSAVRIACLLLCDCFRGGKITSSIDENGDGSPEVYILDHSVSPVEGKNGLMYAFNDGSAYPRLRSSALYAQLEASLSIQLIATLTALDPYMVKYHLHPKRDYQFTIHDCPKTFEVVNNGLTDAVYKLEHGYHSKAMGKYYDWHENNGWSWLYWKNWFIENIKR